ncbi:plasma kallikrein-like [Mya arenaria]|uniref:plasma kallikrein-like n=1 Tax=Mya arenaria TaxID=6604 RepID=UPI0022E0358D|nr:plasma kallikrein-like [Mya arenaria]XP_052785102.1 plasma kallikrein-like [Mya arenaria]
MLALALTCLIAAVSAQTIPCGVPTVQPIQSRIVGGVVATPGSWPWLVLLVDDLGYISGSGVLIDQHVILTSAQHFEGYGYDLYDMDVRNWRIYAGEYNISTTDPNEQRYHIKRVVIHPGYNITSLEADIALVITSAPITFNDHTRPGCLPTQATKAPVGTLCYLPGWGGTRNTGNEEVMNQVDLPILDDSVCMQHDPYFIPNTEMCAGYENKGKDWCWDDLGSPLMSKANSGAWVIQGLASSGGNCTLADEPSNFEDVSMYTDWIRTTMEQAGYPYQY